MTLLYAGPSWAFQSYNTQDGNEPYKTSVFKELQLSAINISKPGGSNKQQLDYIKTNSRYRNNPVIWLYCEPLLDLKHYKGIEYHELIEREDWLSIRKEVNVTILNEINDLGVPVAIIGSHSDVTDCSLPNIEIIEQSYQKCLCDVARIPYNCLGWGPEMMHKSILLHGNLKPTRSLVDEISKTYNVWKQLESNGLFFDVHPTVNGVVEFSAIIKSKLDIWCKKYGQ
jgi:hypothetical protein